VLGRLGPGPDHHQVHVEVRGPGHCPGHRVGDVVGGERLGHPGVDRRGLARVAAEAVERELAGLHHAGGDLDHPDRLVVQLQPQRGGQRVRAVLGRDVPAATLVGHEPGRRPHHHDRARPAGHQRGQQGLGDVQGAEHVHLVHGPPVVRRPVRDLVAAHRPARVGDQHVTPVKRGGQRVHRGPVGHVQRPGLGPAALAADLLGQRLDPVGPPGRGHHVVAGLGQPDRGGRPDPAAGPGHDSYSSHARDSASRLAILTM